MRKINMLCIAVLLVLSAGCDSSGQLSPTQHIDQAKTSIAQKDFSTALVYLKNAALSTPKNPEVRWLMGTAYFATGDSAAAAKELTLAGQYGYPLTDVQPLLAKALFENRQPEKVLKLTAPIAIADVPKASLLATKGWAYLVTDKIQASEQMFSDSLALNDKDSDALSGIGALRLIQGQLQEAKELLARSFETNPLHHLTWRLSGDIAQREGDVKTAQTAYLRASELHHDNVIDLLNFTTTSISLGEFDSAKNGIKQLKQRASNSFAANYTQGLLDFHQKNYESARTNLSAALGINPNYAPAQFYAATSYFVLKENEQAHTLLSKILASAPQNMAALKMLAAIKLQYGEFAKAEKIIQGLLSRSPEDTFSLLLLEKALDRDTDFDTQQAFLTQTPNDLSASELLQQGLQLLADGKITSGLSMLEKSRNTDPSFEETPYRLALYHLSNKNYDEALKTAQQYLDAHPTSAQALVTLGSVYLSGGHFDEAKTTLLSALKISPNDLSANSGLAALALGARDLEGAKNHYLNALKGNPGSLVTLINLSRVQSLQGLSMDMVKTLERAIELENPSWQPYLALGRFHLNSGAPKKATLLIEKARLPYRNNPQALILFTESLLADKQFNRALRYTEELIKNNPTNSHYLFLSSKAYAGLKQQEIQESRLIEALKLNPNHISARANYIELLLRKHDIENAKKQFSLLKDKKINPLDLDKLEGQISHMSGDYPTAILAYKNVFNGEETNIHLLWLEEALWSNGDFKKSLLLLQEWLNEYPEDQLALQQYGSRLITSKQNIQAADTYNKLLSLHPSNLLALNNLAWLLRDTDLNQALIHAEKAYSLAPTNVDIMDTLALLLKDIQPARSLNLITEVVEKQPRNPSYLYHKALILIQSGDQNRARDILQTLQNNGRDFPEKNTISQMIKGLTNSKI